MSESKEGQGGEIRLADIIQLEPHSGRMQELENCLRLAVEQWDDGCIGFNNKPGTIYCYEEAADAVITQVRQAYADKGLLRHYDFSTISNHNQPITGQGVAHGLKVMARYIYHCADHVSQVAPDTGLEELSQLLQSAVSRDSLRQLAREARYTNQHLERNLGLLHTSSHQLETKVFEIGRRGMIACDYRQKRADVMDQLRAEGQPAEYIYSQPESFCKALPGGHWNRVYDAMVQLCVKDPRLMSSTMKRHRPSSN
ncbi:MAG TPA: hypothetical protein VFG56_02315 [Candidatus Saccharimonadales bacterium]|nr:hypothetical protein [Candidatus Saccharimonadales bacterium]